MQYHYKTTFCNIVRTINIPFDKKFTLPDCTYKLETFVFKQNRQSFATAMSFAVRPQCRLQNDPFQTTVRIKLIWPIHRRNGKSSKKTFYAET